MGPPAVAARPDLCLCLCAWDGAAGRSPCAEGNGGCMHTCQELQGLAQCGCHAGFQLAADRKACEGGKPPLLHPASVGRRPPAPQPLMLGPWWVGWGSHTDAVFSQDSSQWGWRTAQACIILYLFFATRDWTHNSCLLCKRCAAELHPGPLILQASPVACLPGSRRQGGRKAWPCPASQPFAKCCFMLDPWSLLPPAPCPEDAGVAAGLWGGGG